MRPFVVFNPSAGGAASPGRLRRLLAGFPSCELVSTRGPGDGARLAARAAEAGHDPIVVAGGDGLLGEVVNGLAPDFGRVRLGLLPMGTGNDFARGLGLPLEPAAAVAAILGGTERAVDLGRAEIGGSGHEPPRFRWFANALVAGLAGRVARRANRGRKSRWGWLAYRAAALPELAGARPVETELVLDGAPGTPGEERLRLDAHALAVVNAPFVGGGLWVAPEAEVDDGLLDVVVVPDLGRMELAAVVLRLLAGGRDAGLLVRRRARRVRFVMPETAWLNADGEDLAGRKATVEVACGALRLLVP